MGILFAGAFREPPWPDPAQRLRVRRRLLPATLACVAIDVVFVGLLVAAWFYMPQGLFLLVVLGYGCMLALHVPILEYALRRYTRQ